MSVRFCSAGALASVIVSSTGSVTASLPPQVRFERSQTTAVTMALATVDVRSEPLAETGLVWRGRVLHHQAVASLRLHVKVQGPPAGWRVKIWSEEAGVVVQTLEAGPPALAPDGTWTRDIPGRAALIDLELTAPGPAPSVAIDQYAYDIRPSVQQAIHGIDGRLAIKASSPRIQELGRSVCRLRIMVAGLGQATCSGFLIADDLILTNEHCVTSASEARATLVDFGYDEPSGTAQTLQGVALEAVNRELDYAVLRLERRPPPAFPRVSFNTAVASASQQLLVVEHPLGGYKQVSIESCEVSDVSMPGVSSPTTDFGHKCDTLNGSSGSPVMDFASGEVVGLHHLGFDPDTRTYVNRAVHAGLVLADIRKRNPALIVSQPVR